MLNTRKVINNQIIIIITIIDNDNDNTNDNSDYFEKRTSAFIRPFILINLNQNVIF